jgi:hypothetical protein
MKTTQTAFHPMRGHVADGCEIQCENGDVLTLNATMKGWQLRDQDGRKYGEETNDAQQVAAYVVGYQGIPEQSASDVVVLDFSQRFAAFQVSHSSLIAELESLVAATGRIDILDDEYWDAVDDLKGELGADAANHCPVSADQEDAISSVESWVANNGPSKIPLLLWVHGVDAGAGMVRRDVGVPTSKAKQAGIGL